MQKEDDQTLFCPKCSSQGMRMKIGDTAVSGKPRYRCNKCKHRTTNPATSTPQILPETKASEFKGVERFLITSALNNTPVVITAHETFKNMANVLGAQYLIIPTVYKNPDLMQRVEPTVWPAEVIPYICNGDIALNKNIIVRGLTRIVHTAINPLSGMNHAGDIRSEVYGHAQVAMEMVATPKNKIPKMMHTTGTISKKNYGGSKTARKASFHHSLSALLVECKGSMFWTTEVHFDGVGAYLFNTYYTPTEQRTRVNVAAIIHGDTHVKFLDKKTDALQNLICAALKPDFRIYHDLHDHHIESHHHDKDTVFKLSKSLRRDLSIRDELMLSVKFLDGKDNAVLVDSNHHRHLNQWFNRFKPHTDTVNCELYFEFGELLREDLKNGGDGNLFRLFVQRYSSSRVSFVDGNQLFSVRGVDCSQHGDVGPNGSRGSARSFSQTGFKTFIGHSHTPRIEKGCYQVGTSTLGLPYAVGYSSWMTTHGIIYDNGKRALYSFVKNKISPLLQKVVDNY